MCLIQLHYRFTVTPLPTKELLYIIVLGSLIGPFDPYADQESTYNGHNNGHNRVHAQNCVALPYGLIGNLYGPLGKFCGECLYKERVGDFNFTMSLTIIIGRLSGVKSERLM